VGFCRTGVRICGYANEEFIMKRLFFALLLCVVVVFAPCQQRGEVAGSGLFTTLGLRYYVPLFPFDGEGVPHSLPGFVVGAGWALPLGTGSLEVGGELGAMFMTASYYMVFVSTVAARAGYVQPLGEGLALTAALTVGALMPWAQAEGIAMQNLLFPSAANRMAIEPSAGARVGVAIPLNARPTDKTAEKTVGRTALFLNVGADMAMEASGPVVLPAVELGVKFSPYPQIKSTIFR
jgi:hypothetical protein